MKIKELFAAIGSATLGILIFSGCEKTTSTGGEETLGCDFHCDITVTDKNGSPIEGIKIYSISDGSEDLPYKLDTLFTDSKGNVHREYQDLSIVGSTYTAIFEDVDGDANGGTFAKDTAQFEIKKIKKVDSSHWYTGTFEAKGNKELEKSE